MTTDLDPADMLAIQRVIARYAWLADEGDWEAVGILLAEADLYAHDRLLASRDGARITEIFSSAKRPPEGTRRHINTNVIIDAESADVATALSYFLWVETLPGEPPRILQCGVNRDRFRKTAEGWRLIERRIESDPVRPAAKAEEER